MRRAIFLTGAGGFLGRSVLAEISEKGLPAVCLIHKKEPAHAPPNVTFLRGDLLRPEGYEAALAECGAVLHLAAVTGKQSPSDYRRVNRDGAAALVEAARRAGVPRFLYVSTVAVNFRVRQRYYYAESKREAEDIVARSGLRWTIVRPAIILGENAPVLDSLSRLAMLPAVVVFGDGRVPVQPVFVDDLAASLLAMLERPELENCTLEVGGPEVLSIEDLMLRIRRVRGAGSAPVLHLPVNLIVRCLSLLEPLLRPLLPITAGQLSSFTNPGTTARHPWVAGRQESMRSVDEMLSATNGYASPRP